MIAGLSFSLALKLLSCDSNGFIAGSAVRLGIGMISLPDQPDGFRQPQKLHDANSPPVEIDFVPGKAMPCRAWVSVVVIVPALTEGQQRHPPVVSRIIASREPPL